MGKVWRAKRSADRVMEHLHMVVIPEVRAERACRHYPSNGKLIFLVQAWSADDYMASQRVQDFSDVQITDELMLRVTNLPGLWCIEDTEALADAALALFENGGSNTSYCDYVRPDATLIHVQNIRK